GGETVEQGVVVVGDEQLRQRLGRAGAILAAPAAGHVEQAVRLARIGHFGESAFLAKHVGHFAAQGHHLLEASGGEIGRLGAVPSRGWLSRSTSRRLSRSTGGRGSRASRGRLSTTSGGTLAVAASTRPTGIGAPKVPVVIADGPDVGGWATE